MYTKPSIVIKYLIYWVRSSNGAGHGTHSPFLYNFIRKVIRINRKLYDYIPVEKLRSSLMRNNKMLTIDDYGAGSSVNQKNFRTVSEIVSTSAKSKKYSRLIFRIVAYFQPKNIIELGTSLGITTAYMAYASPKSNIFTIEGSKEIARWASKNFTHLQLTNIKLFRGHFDEVLPFILKDLDTVDFVFIDGNHRYEPTINYFNQLLEKINNNSILVFDDIHWSKEMEKAWAEIKAHPSVKVTIDIFFMGIVFFRSEFLEKQHYRIRL